MFKATHTLPSHVLAVKVTKSNIAHIPHRLADMFLNPPRLPLLNEWVVIRPSLEVEIWSDQNFQRKFQAENGRWEKALQKSYVWVKTYMGFGFFMPEALAPTNESGVVYENHLKAEEIAPSFRNPKHHMWRWRGIFKPYAYRVENVVSVEITEENREFLKEFFSETHLKSRYYRVGQYVVRYPNGRTRIFTPTVYEAVLAGTDPELLEPIVPGFTKNDVEFPIPSSWLESGGLNGLLVVRPMPFA